MNSWKTTQNKKAVIYCRVSSKEQVEEGNSLVTQERLCGEYAQKNKYDVNQIFIEQGESAKTTNRPELQKLITFCANKKNKIEAVIVYKIDRLSRNIDDYSQLRVLLKRYGVKIESISENFEDNPAGRFMENIIANIAQFDNDIRTERTINGMREAVREGRYVWSAPIGYDNVRVAGKATIAMNHIATMVRKTFEKVAKHTDTLEGTRQKMTEAGLVHKNGNPMSKSQFYRMLRNELYAGWIIKFGEQHKGLFKPIVSQELFDQVQAILAHRKRRNFHYLKECPDFPLRRFITHTTGLRATGCWSQGRSKKYPYYRFRMKGLQFKKEKLENSFVDFLNKISLSENQYDKLRSYVREQLNVKTSNMQRRSEQLKKYLDRLYFQQRGVIQKNIDGIINDEILQQQLKFIEEDIRKTKHALADIPDRRKDLDKLLEFISYFLKNPGEVWKNISFQNKLKLQWFTCPEGVMFDGINCYTSQLPFIFKEKGIILQELSHRVYPMHHKSLPQYPINKKEIVQELMENQITVEIERFYEIFRAEKELMK